MGVGGVIGQATGAGVGGEASAADSACNVAGGVLPGLPSSASRSMGGVSPGRRFQTHAGPPL
eukprot:1832268-Alexandrium_andersonii.AAC.1